MKRVSIGFLLLHIALFLGVTILGTQESIQLRYCAILVFFVLCFLVGVFPLIYPKTFERKMSKLAEEKKISGMGFRSDFFIPESYFIDTTNGYLIGITLFHPFKFQYIDLVDVTNVEIVKVIFNQSVVASIRCRLHMEKKNFDIWLYRDARYQPVVDIDSEKDKVISEAAEKTKCKIEDAVIVAKSKRQ